MTMLAPAGQAGYTLSLATDGDRVRAAQRLRHQVFAEELGATLHSGVPGLDVDEFDEYCDHLVIQSDATGEVVGTYRMLPPGAAPSPVLRHRVRHERARTAARPSRRDRRSCVHPEHRTGAVINLIWAGIARYLHLSGHRWLGGCASVPLDDGGPSRRTSGNS